MHVYATWAFWVAALERAIKTTAQVVLGLFASNVVGITDVDWAQVGSVAGLAAVISLLTSVASAKVGGDGPSLGAETLATSSVHATGEVEK